MSNIIEVKGINKSYNTKSVLKEISLSVKENSILGLIGENGAGKTTLIKSILGLITVSKGTVLIQGKRVDNNEDHILNNVGFLLEPRYYSYLSTYNNLKSILILSGKYTNNSDNEINNILDFLSLSEVKKRKVNKFSFGMKQRVGLAQALITKPNILILDEPLVGLDPSGTDLFKQKIRELYNAHKCTIIFSSHQLNDIQELCSEVAVLKNGKILVHDKTENLVENITEFIFEKPIDKIAEEIIALGKKVHLSEDKRILSVNESDSISFKLISDLYSESMLINIENKKVGLEKYFGKEIVHESLKI